jgi:hypothetical protein
MWLLGGRIANEGLGLAHPIDTVKLVLDRLSAAAIPVAWQPSVESNCITRPFTIATGRDVDISSTSHRDPDANL